MFFIALLVFLVLLAKLGRIGPFTWEPRFAGLPASTAPATPAGPPMPAMPTEIAAGGAASGWTGWAGRHDDPETILARRLADGEITSDDYLERMSLLSHR